MNDNDNDTDTMRSIIKPVRVCTANIFPYREHSKCIDTKSGDVFNEQKKKHNNNNKINKRHCNLY